MPFLTAAVEYAVLAFDNLHREVFEIQFLAAANSRHLRFVDACAQGEIYRGSRADDLGPEALGDEWDITYMVGMAVAREDVVGSSAGTDCLRVRKGSIRILV